MSVTFSARWVCPGFGRRYDAARVTQLLADLLGTGLTPPQAMCFSLGLRHRRWWQWRRGPTAWVDWLPEFGGLVGTYAGVEWDLEHARIPASQAVQILREQNRPIWLAMLWLQLDEHVAHALGRWNSPQNERDLTPCDLWLRIEPMVLGPPGPRLPVGELSVSISGYGYCYPWTQAEFRQRLEAHPAVAAMMSACRRRFPVAPRPASPALRRRREHHAAAWCGQPTDAPQDWCWIIEEFM